MLLLLYRWSYYSYYYYYDRDCKLWFCVGMGMLVRDVRTGAGSFGLGGPILRLVAGLVYRVTVFLLSISIALDRLLLLRSGDVGFFEEETTCLSFSSFNVVCVTEVAPPNFDGLLLLFKACEGLLFRDFLPDGFFLWLVADLG